MSADKRSGESNSRIRSVADAILSGSGLDEHGRPMSSSSSGGSTSGNLGGPSTSSRPTPRFGFLKPGSQPPTPGSTTGASTPTGPAPPDGLAARRTTFVQSGYDNSSKPSTPVPQLFTPQLPRTQQNIEASTSGQLSRNDAGNEGSSSNLQAAMSTMRKRDREEAPPLDPSALNKLQAKVMKAELTGAANAKSLRAKLDAALAQAQRGGDAQPGFFDVDPKGGGLLPVEGKKEVHMLPTLDGHGRLYDVGHGSKDDRSQLPGNRKKKQKLETHDNQTGERIRYEDETDNPTLAELVRQERFGGGAADQKSMDAALAAQISRDGAYKNDIDYIDERADRLARKNMKSDALKRQFAIQDFARTKRALDSCEYCWQEEGARPPRATVICSGTRTFLALPRGESLVEGHCYIVPMQHYISSLEADDDCWEEIKNFMKCLMQMAAARKQGIIFCETVISIHAQRHTYIEAIPVPQDLFQQIPAVFKQSILTSEEEWSQNRKIIEFKDRGFRRTMVPKLPYFMVQWDYKGFQGYGKVIEGVESNAGGKGGDEFALEETGTSGGEFPRYFAAEIVGTLLDLEPRRWRNPRRVQGPQVAERVQAFKKRWSAYDWTKMLDQAAEASGAGLSERAVTLRDSTAMEKGEVR
ncbi:Pre-mRNA-splicing factor cwf19 [Tilletia horrida]|uniref:Pre-mRNA-splicing factor cwf19 n=1 Tax=Tilletia horrida TaxID=155126 RepID=A0AAN6GKQ0_9BASI|nr:Pre-mRNA-splicing factor cwf19 [Tilletia horrida]KAK0549494.1 Pre-mRNA-splicing factor cwf19 [Tilletia horrida]KAK0561758.1 Pre-mRNA-splicing factor cwf19 [Tilletia horrida]